MISLFSFRIFASDADPSAVGFRDHDFGWQMISCIRLIGSGSDERSLQLHQLQPRRASSTGNQGKLLSTNDLTSAPKGAVLKSTGKAGWEALLHQSTMSYGTLSATPLEVICRPSQV